jgi:hypothetical protein
VAAVVAGEQRTWGIEPVREDVELAAVVGHAARHERQRDRLLGLEVGVQDDQAAGGDVVESDVENAVLVSSEAA